MNVNEFVQITVLNLDPLFTRFNQSPITRVCWVWMHRYALFSHYTTNIQQLQPLDKVNTCTWFYRSDKSTSTEDEIQG